MTQSITEATNNAYFTGFGTSGKVNISLGTDGMLDTSFNSTLTNTLDGKPSFTEGGSAVILDSNVQLSGYYIGDTLSLQRS